MNKYPTYGKSSDMQNQTYGQDQTYTSGKQTPCGMDNVTSEQMSSQFSKSQIPMFGQIPGQAAGQMPEQMAGLGGTTSVPPNTTSASPNAQGNLFPITPTTEPMPVTTQSVQYINGFLRTQIGRKVTVNFLIGTNSLQDRTGTLLAVGANYIILREVETDDLLVCDFYSIKFVRIYF